MAASGACRAVREEHPPVGFDVSIALQGGGRMPAAFFPVPGATEPRPGVLVIHELLGLTGEMRRLAGQFADAGFTALAPDFLDGLGPKPFCIARFARGIGRPGTGRPYRQLEVARQWLATRAEVDGQPIGVAGFCIGGGFALLYAAGADVHAVAPFYPAVPDEEQLRGVCPVVASFGGRDRVFGEGGPRLVETLDRLGVERDVRTYPDAGHGFMARYDGPLGWLGERLPTRVAHDPAAAADAWDRTIAFFRQHLGPASAASAPGTVAT
jgi:carboxymethylenebutenolidase